VASIVNEIESIYEYIKQVFPTEKAHFQRIPSEIKANEISIRYLIGDSTNETGYHYRLDHDFQIVYFAKTELECITKLSEMERCLNAAMSIPIKDSDRYMRIDSFGNSQPFKTESGIYSIIGILSVQTREARPQAEVPKVEEVGITTYAGSDVAKWDILDGEGTPENPIDGFTFDDLEIGAYIFGKGVK
jgi:hypothetical protein